MESGAAKLLTASPTNVKTFLNIKITFLLELFFFIFYFTAMLGLPSLLTVPGQQLPLQVLTDLRTNHAGIAMRQPTHVDL